MWLNKKDYLEIIKTIEIIDGNISSDQDSGIIKINIVGMKMQQQEKQISLKSIYDLVVNITNDVDILKQDITELKNDIIEIKQDISNMKTDINQLKNDNKEIKKEIKELKLLPTIAKELKQNNIL